MLKFVLSLFLIVFLSACGVETSSSDSEDVKTSSDTDYNNSNNSNNQADPTDPTDPTDPSDPTDPTDPVDPIDENITSIFDITGAVEDPFACIIGDSNDGYTPNSISDDSFDYADTTDEEDGIGVNSRFPTTKDLEQATVSVFYYDLKVYRLMSNVNIQEDDFRISVDRGWVNNDETIIYARTPKNKDGLYECYRYELDNIDVNSTVVGVKVFRREIE